MHGIISLSTDEYPVFGKSEVVILPGDTQQQAAVAECGSVHREPASFASDKQRAGDRLSMD